MHVRIIALICLIFSAICVNARNPRIDSLKNAYETQALDSNRVNTLRSLGIAYRSYSKDTSLLYLQKSVDEAKQIEFALGISKGLYAKALTYGMTGDYADALAILALVEEQAIKIEDYERIVFSNNARGIIYKRLGDYPASKAYYLKNIQLADSLNLSVNLSSVYSNLGILYDLTDEKERALASYRKAIEVHKGTGLEDLKRNVEANIAVMEFSDGNFESALLLFKNSSRTDDKIDRVTAFSNIGLCYMHLRNWKSSESYLDSALVIARELGLKKEEMTVLRNKSELMFKQGMLDNAEIYYKQALGLLDGYGRFQWKKEVYELAFQIHEQKGELEEAIKNLKMAIVYKDSLFNEAKLREIHNMELQHNVFVKNQEIEQQEKELVTLEERIALENRKKILLGVIALLSIFSAALLVYGYQRKQRSNELLTQKNELIRNQKERIEEMNLELEKRMLRAQMNPHFIFNSLNSIQHFITENDKKSALTYLTKFSKLLRQVLESSIDLNVILEEEVKLLKIYVELEALRFDDSFTYEFRIDESLDTYAHEIPILLIQPYIENAIIHGLIPKEGSKHLVIGFEDAKEYIKCVIEDNGIGRKSKPKTEKNHTSRGMSVTEQRIRALEKTNFQLVMIEDLEADGHPAGTRVTVAIPKT